MNRRNIYKLTPTIIEQVAALAEKGNSDQIIRWSLGIPEQFFYNLMTRPKGDLQKLFRQKIEVGRSINRQRLVDCVMKDATCENSKLAFEVLQSIEKQFSKKAVQDIDDGGQTVPTVIRIIDDRGKKE